MRNKVIKLAWVKDKDPKFVIRDKENGDKTLGTSLPMKVTGVQFKPEEYDGNISYKLKCRGIVTTESGKEVPVLVDFGGSGLAKGFANSLLSAKSDLSSIKFSVYKSKNSDSFGWVILDLTLPNNGVKWKDNSQNLAWAISGDDRASLIETITTKKGTTYDDTSFCETLSAMIEDKLGESHPFVLESSTRVDDSLFGDDIEQSLSDEDIDIGDIPTSKSDNQVTEQEAEDILESTF